MKKFLLILVLILVAIYLIISFLNKPNSYISSWEKEEEIPNIKQKQFEGWGWKALKNHDLNNSIRKVKVAIIDSGIDGNHSDLKGIIKKEYNAINEGEQIIDDTGHGTSVAGIIGAIDNEFGIRGVVRSSNLEVYSIKAFENNISSVEYLERALKWAIKSDVDLINLSAGTSKYSIELKKLIDTAIEQNIIIVAAAGNNISGDVDFPANLDSVISVGAVNYNLKKISGTSYGKIDFVGPGSNIIAPLPGNKYGYFGYTSAATAFVSGVVLNKISSYPDKNSYDFQDIYDELKKDVIPLGDNLKYGNGFVRN